MAIIGLTCRKSGSLSFSTFATGGIVAPDESARAPVHHSALRQTAGSTLEDKWRTLKLP
jgi:hypothetical protein